MANKGKKINQHCDRTLCWDCRRAVPDQHGHGCEWSTSFLPVPKWKATRTIVHMGKNVVRSYCVHRCPKYQAEAPREPLPCDKYIPDRVGRDGI